MNEPILTKREARTWDNQPMTWKMFLSLRKWAEEFTKETGHKVYLVGSALYKEIPRDIDISVIIPHDEYEELFGEWPTDTQKQYSYLANVYYRYPNHAKHYFECLEALGDKVTLDFKICSDAWWPEKPKLLLIEPRG